MQTANKSECLKCKVFRHENFVLMNERKVRLNKPNKNKFYADLHVLPIRTKVKAAQSWAQQA